MRKRDNHLLGNAKKNINDEYLTRYESIEEELNHEEYRKAFIGKVVYCNCDHPKKSNFVRYFRDHFFELKIRKLVSTYYKAGRKTAYKNEWYIDNGVLKHIKRRINGSGDFGSRSCLQTLKKADIVVTNPPFSMYSKFVSLLLRNEKKFIIIGNKNSIANSTIFRIFMEDKIHLGYNLSNGNIFFRSGGKDICVSSYWFTNIDTEEGAQKPLKLKYCYKGREEYYIRYDNYDAINCDKVKEIPYDYVPCWFECGRNEACPYARSKGLLDVACDRKCNGIIGVPLTYLASHHNSRRYELLGITDGSDAYDPAARPVKKYINPLQHTFSREENRWNIDNGAKLNARAALPTGENTNTRPYYTADNADGRLKLAYARILIRRAP